MRYPAEQKTETHGLIVETAAREFRSKGLRGVGIADLMSEVGLTHGGFYAHFKDRDALVAETSVRAAAESFRHLTEAAEAAPPGKEVEAMLNRYLSLAHRDDQGRGCLLPALSADLARQPEPVRSAFTDALKANMPKFARYMPAKDNEAKVTQAVMLLSGMAGGILLARAINDPEFSGLVLDSVRTQLLNLYGSWCA